MDIFVTEIRAIAAATGEMGTYAGENVEGLSIEDAQSWCDIHKPYLKVIGRLCMTMELTWDGAPNWDTAIDLDKMKNN